MQTVELTAHDLDLVDRAAAHAMAEYVLPAAARFQRNVTDLDVARLILALERGTVIVPSATGRSWHTVPRGDRMPPLTRVIEEAMRVGLVHPDTVKIGDIARTQLVAAPVHLRVQIDRNRRGTACRASQDIPFGRFRTLDNRDLVDCSACLMAHR